MNMHAFAPSRMAAPSLWAKGTWVKELGVTWNDLGGISIEEINLLAEMGGIWHEATELKRRVHG